jgi:hypothetical protein
VKAQSNSEPANLSDFTESFNNWADKNSKTNQQVRYYLQYPAEMRELILLASDKAFREIISALSKRSLKNHLPR